MNIPFLKSLMGSTPEAMALPSITGMVPAFPEDMIFEEHQSDTGTQPSVKSSDSLLEMPELVSARSEDPISLNIKSIDHHASTDKILPPIELVNNLLASVEHRAGSTPVEVPAASVPVIESNASVPVTNSESDHSDLGTIKLSDIDRSAKILPFVNAATPKIEAPAPDKIMPEHSSVDQRSEVAGAQANVTPKLETVQTHHSDAETVEPKPAHLDNGKTHQLPPAGTNERTADVSMAFNRANLDNPRANQSGDRELDGREFGLSRAASSVEQARPADVKSDTVLPNIPAQLLQNLKQLHIAPTRGPKDLVSINEKVEPHLDAEPVMPDTLNTDEVSKQSSLAGLSANVRLKRASIGDTATALASAGIKEVSTAMNRISDVAAVRSAAQASVETFLDFDTNFIANLAREIGNIAQSRGTARFSLRPEHLGRVDIEIRGGENGDEIKLTTETESVRQFLAQSQSKLEQEARLQGHRLSGVEIGTALHQNNERGTQDSTRSENKTATTSEESQENEIPQRRRGDRLSDSENNARFA